MFLFSIRLSRKRMVLGALALVALVGLGVAGFRLFSGGEEMTSSAVPVTETAGDTVKTQKVTAKTEEERIAFMKSFGWEISHENVEVMEVIIPAEFDQVYEDYNTIQKMQGFDLERYAGKRCKRYSYVITNYPGADCEIRFNLMQYGDKVVGGDVCSADAGGFMHGFAPQA